LRLSFALDLWTNDIADDFLGCFMPFLFLERNYSSY